MSRTSRSWRLKTTLPMIGLLSLPGCATRTPISEATPAPSSNPCLAIAVPDIDQATRNQVAKEEVNAPDSAAWPDQIEAYLKMRAGVETCRAAKE